MLQTWNVIPSNQLITQSFCQLRINLKDAVPAHKLTDLDANFLNEKVYKNALDSICGLSKFDALELFGTVNLEPEHYVAVGKKLFSPVVISGLEKGTVGFIPSVVRNLKNQSSGDLITICKITKEQFEKIGADRVVVEIRTYDSAPFSKKALKQIVHHMFFKGVVYHDEAREIKYCDRSINAKVILSTNQPYIRIVEKTKIVFRRDCVGIPIFWENFIYLKPDSCLKIKLRLPYGGPGVEMTQKQMDELLDKMYPPGEMFVFQVKRMGVLLVVKRLEEE